VTGPGEVARVIDDRTLRLTWAPLAGDPLAEVVETGVAVGLLVPDLATRRRMRVNGRVVLREAGAIVVRSEQVYANCPKYIEPRSADVVARLGTRRRVTTTSGLSAVQRAWLQAADTFFITTGHPVAGVDTSHRGGPPGFVAVDGATLRWPDFPGNAMFNTLGNIAVHPRAGLLVPDFSTGGALQLTGTAAIEWDGDGTRRVALAVEEVREHR
jgi:predicted pyridoxine 5'-phosphate oxidase superfamily flavin-nucleotide-binding protein